MSDGRCRTKITMIEHILIKNLFVQSMALVKEFPGLSS